MRINNINKSIKKRLLNRSIKALYEILIKNDLSSQLRKRTMFEILANFIGEIFSAFSWKKIIDENGKSLSE